MAKQNCYKQSSKVTIGDMSDITGAEHVQIYISRQGVLWVNVDGLCVLRCCKTKHLQILDERTRKEITDALLRQDEDESEALQSRTDRNFKH